MVSLYWVSGIGSAVHYSAKTPDIFGSKRFESSCFMRLDSGPALLDLSERIEKKRKRQCSRAGKGQG